MDLGDLATGGAPQPSVQSIVNEVVELMAAAPGSNSNKLGVMCSVDDIISSGDITFVDHDPPQQQQQLRQECGCGGSGSIAAVDTKGGALSEGLCECPSLRIYRSQRPSLRPLPPQPHSYLNCCCCCGGS